MQKNRLQFWWNTKYVFRGNLLNIPLIIRWLIITHLFTNLFIHSFTNIFFEHCWYCLRHLFHLPTFAKSNVHLYQCDFLSSFHHYKQLIWHFYVLLQNKFHFMNTAKNILQGRQGCSLKGSRCCLCHIVEQIVLWDPAWSSENDPYIRVCNKQSLAKQHIYCNSFQVKRTF